MTFHVETSKIEWITNNSKFEKGLETIINKDIYLRELISHVSTGYTKKMLSLNFKLLVVLNKRATYYSRCIQFKNWSEYLNVSKIKEIISIDYYRRNTLT